MIFCKVPLQGLLKLKGFKKGKTGPCAEQWIFSSKGSSAIILSVMVSGSVLATIFYNQQSMQWALSSQASNKSKWSDQFIKKYGITLGSYLVANNLILCREGGWDDAEENEPLCKWNDIPTRPSEPSNPDSTDNNNAGSTETSTDNNNAGSTETSTDNNNAGRTTNRPIQRTGNLDAGGDNRADSSAKAKLSQFNLKEDDPDTIQIGDTEKKVLRYEASVQEDSINAGQEIKFNLTFDLVNWKDSAIKNLIGEIPEYMCRHKTNHQIIKHGHCTTPPVSALLNPLPANSNPDSVNTNVNPSFQAGCKESADPNAEDIPNSICEFISAVDADYSIVLISVQLLEKEEDGDSWRKKQGQAPAYAGVRRPLAIIKMEVTQQANCSLSCAISNTPNSNPSCRGDFQPEPNSLTQSIILKITNKGPGALYKLSLLRKEQPKPIVDTGENPITPTYEETGDILEIAKKKVLLPNEAFRFNDQVECKNTFQYEFSTTSETRRQTWGEYQINPIRNTIVESSSTTLTDGVNVHAQPYMTLSYTLGALNQPTAICMKDGISIDGDCSNKQKDDSCGDQGTCVHFQAEIEPNRGIFPGSGEINIAERTTTLKTVVRYVSPH